MFGISNTMGITIDKKCMDNLKEENKKLLNVFLKIYELLLDRDIKELDKIIPNIQIKQIIGEISSKQKWLEDIKNENIKYYGIDIIDVKVKNERIELTSRIRAKFGEYKGCWKVDSCLMFKQLDSDFTIKEILI